MIISWKKIKRIWFYIRRGRLFTTFIVSIITSTIIWYVDLKIISKYFPNLQTFFIFFVTPTLILTALLGYIDYKYGSVETDAEMQTLKNPINVDLSLKANYHSQLSLMYHIMGDNKKAELQILKSLKLIQYWMERADEENKV